MRHRLKHAISNLTLVRLIVGLAKFLIRLGYLESRLWLMFWRGVAGAANLSARLLSALGESVYNPFKAAAVWLSSIGDKATKKAGFISNNLKAMRVKPKALFLKPAIAYALMLLLIVAPIGGYKYYRDLLHLKDRLISAASAAFADIKSAGQDVTDQNFTGAESEFAAAGLSFQNLEKGLSEVNGLMFDLIGMAPDEKFKMAAAAPELARAGSTLSEFGGNLSLAMASLLDDSSADLTVRIANFLKSGQIAKENADRALSVLNSINYSAWPEGPSGQFVELKGKLSFAAESLTELLDVAEKINIFLGDSQDRRYLLVFQNHTEARATGGFMGSFSIVDFSRGKVKKITTPGGGTYDVEGGSRQISAAPEPLRLVNAKWQLWDANWWPDWPTSARKIIWFYEKSDGSTPDGVISLTPKVVTDLMELTGPIILPQYNETITAENFMDVVQYYAEQKDAATSTPKRIIGDLTDALTKKLSENLDRERIIKLIGILEENFNQKNILLYFNEPRLAEKARAEGWDGRVRETSGDYLMVVNTNIAGGKSDKKILQTIDLVTEVTDDGEIIDTVTVKRQHAAIRGEEFSGVRNNDWLRVYVPLGSELLSAAGFRAPEAGLFEAADQSWTQDENLNNEINAAVDPFSGTKIYREGDKTVFANWSMVDPGETAILKFSYKLPFKLSVAPKAQESWTQKLSRFTSGEDLSDIFRYTLLVQKQSGAVNSRLKTLLTPADGYNIVWLYPENSSDSYQLQTGDLMKAVLLSR